MPSRVWKKPTRTSWRKPKTCTKVEPEGLGQVDGAAPLPSGAITGIGNGDGAESVVERDRRRRPGSNRLHEGAKRRDQGWICSGRLVDGSEACCATNQSMPAPIDCELALGTDQIQAPDPS